MNYGYSVDPWPFTYSTIFSTTSGPTKVLFLKGQCHEFLHFILFSREQPTYSFEHGFDVAQLIVSKVQKYLLRKNLAHINRSFYLIIVDSIHQSSFTLIHFVLSNERYRNLSDFAVVKLFELISHCIALFLVQY